MLLPSSKSAQARAVSEMRDDHPALGETGIVVFQDGRDVVVGQPVEAVAPNAALAHFARQGEQSRDVRLGLMEGSIETGDLRHPRKAASHDPDRLQVMGLMQRRERHQRLKRLEDGFVDQHRAGIGRAAVDDPVSDGDELAPFLMLAQPRDEMHQRILVPDLLALAPGALVQNASARILDGETRIVRPVPRRDLSRQAAALPHPACRRPGT